MTFEEYRFEAMKTANWKSQAHQHVPPDVYCALKLNGEAGEVAEKIGKIYRDHNGVYGVLDKRAIALEIGDVLWYLAGLCDVLEISMEKVVELNLEKHPQAHRVGRAGQPVVVQKKHEHVVGYLG